MTATNEDVRMLLKETIRAAETHDWLRASLMEDSVGRMVGINAGRLCLVEASDDPENFYVECDAVAACCTVGYITFAVTCLTPLLHPRETAAKYALRERLEELLWRRAEVVEAARIWYFDRQEDFYDEKDGHVLNFDEWVARFALPHDAIGPEGLLPFWNDNIAQSRDDVLALLREAEEALDD